MTENSSFLRTETERTRSNRNSYLVIYSWKPFRRWYIVSRRESQVEQTVAENREVTRDEL